MRATRAYILSNEEKKGTAHHSCVLVAFFVEHANQFRAGSSSCRLIFRFRDVMDHAGRRADVVDRLAAKSRAVTDEVMKTNACQNG